MDGMCNYQVKGGASNGWSWLFLQNKRWQLGSGQTGFALSKVKNQWGKTFYCSCWRKVYDAKLLRRINVRGGKQNSRYY